MIKRLLVVLTLNIGILQGLAATTLPGDDTLITNPEGQTEVYCEAFRSIDAANNLPWIYGKKNDIVWGNNSEVYFRRPLCDRLIPNDYYLKGVKDSNHITISLPQLVSTSGKAKKYIWAMIWDDTNKTYTPQGAPSDIIFNIADDGTISMDMNSKTIFALGDSEGNWQLLSQHGYTSGASEIIYHPADMTPEVPPSDVPVEKWWMKSNMLSGAVHDTYVNVAIADNELFIQGISVQHPQAWLKGEINDNGDVRTVSVKGCQFAGWDENANELSYFFGYTYDGHYDSEKRAYIQENARLLSPSTPVVFNYDPVAKTLTAPQGQGISVNNDVSLSNMWESFGYISFSRNGAVFSINVPWGVTEMAMTFKVIDEDARLCQVGNGNIPVDNDDLSGQAIWDIYTGTVTVPEIANGYRVVRVGRGAFEQMPRVTSVILPDCVEQIDEYAFHGDNAMTEFHFPSSLKVIKDYAFFRSGIKEVSLNNLTTVGVGAFSNCDNLTEVIWPANLTDIPESAFEECYGLTKVRIANGVTEIGQYAFAFCQNLKEIDMGSVTTLYNIGRLAFKSIGCTELVLPEGVKSIGRGVFNGLDKLQSLTSLAKVPPVIEDEHEGSINTFASLPETSVLYVPQGCVDAYSAQKNWSDFLTMGGIIEIDSSGINGLVVDKSDYENAPWYTIDGRRLSGKPKSKGIYIHGKNKILIAE